jgi:hypothetical protein
MDAQEAVEIVIAVPKLHGRLSHLRELSWRMRRKHCRFKST